MSIWERFFGKKLDQYFLAFSPAGSSWSVVSWNQPFGHVVIEVHKDIVEKFQWEKAGGTIAYFKDDRLEAKGKSDQTLRASMNIALHSTLKLGLENHRPFLLEAVSGATALDVQAEGRSLQWIQASFGTLSRALDKFQVDPQLVLGCSVFMGKEPASGEHVVRVLAFNLDIFYYFKADHSLQIIVFDDKDLGHGESKTPVFQQIIKVTKPQFYDEITKLVNKIAVLGELK